MPNPSNEPPAPPAEPVEGAQRKRQCANCGHQKHEGECVPCEFCGEGMPVEAQPCKHCDHAESVHVLGGCRQCFRAAKAYMHRFERVEVEDEGARPLSVEDGLTVVMERFVTIRMPREAWRELLQPYAAAIHKEAIVALAEWTQRGLDAVYGELARERAGVDEWRTRAEAAEGDAANKALLMNAWLERVDTLVKQLSSLAARAHEVNKTYRSDDFQIQIDAARALTAESVTRDE